MSLVPRLVSFNKEGICTSVGNPSHYAHNRAVVSLSTDHCDFVGPINPVGMTMQEIQQAVSNVR